MNLIEAKGLTKKFQDKVVINGLDMVIGQGEILGPDRTQWGWQIDDDCHAVGNSVAGSGIDYLLANRLSTASGRSASNHAIFRRLFSPGESGLV